MDTDDLSANLILFFWNLAKFILAYIIIIIMLINHPASPAPKRAPHDRKNG